MATPPAQRNTSDVPSAIFAAFLDALAATDTPPAKIAALRKILQEEPDISEGSVLNAMAAEENIP